MKSKKTDVPKTRGLFDHINHIREVKNPNYYVSLSEEEKKSFNKYMILRVLSMDSSLIEPISILSKYFQVLPDEQFYKVIVNIVPKGRKFCKYIKKSTENINETVLKCICDKFSVGEKDAFDYYSIMISSDQGVAYLVKIIQGYGFSEKEVEKIFE